MYNVLHVYRIACFPIFITYMLAFDGQMAGPNWVTFLGYSGVTLTKAKKSFFFFKI